MAEIMQQNYKDVLGMKSICSSIASITCCEDMTKEELIIKLKEYRKSSIELLEDKRHLLLRSQEAYKMEIKLRKNEAEIRRLKECVKLLENRVEANKDEITNNAIKEVVRQLSCSSNLSSDELINNSHREEDTNNSHREEDTNTNFAETFEEFQDSCADKKNPINLHHRTSNMDGRTKKCCCGLEAKYTQLVKVNHLWQKDYDSLLEQHNNTKARLWKTESELKLTLTELKDLQQRLEHDNENGQSVNGPLPECNLYSPDDIEALKQQLIIFKEDYMAEKEDNKKLTEQMNKIKLELQKAYGMIDSLTLKHNRVKENYRRVSFEKERIINELRRLSTSSLPFSPVSDEDRAPARRQIRGSNEILDSLCLENMPPHSAQSPIHIPPSTQGRIYVERDSISETKRRMSSPPDLAYRRVPLKGRVSPPSPDRMSPGSSSPLRDHITFVELHSIDESIKS